jgi:hypothetical protein
MDAPQPGPSLVAPDSAAQRGNRICAPMQPNAVIGIARLGGKPFIEHAFETGLRDSRTVILAKQV